MSAPDGRDRRRHVRVAGSWTVTASGIEHTGGVRRFEATMLDISVSGILLEAAITANLWADKPLTIDLPGSVGAVAATVHRFLEYGQQGSHTTRWGVELTGLTMVQRVQWARFVFTAARHAEHASGTLTSSSQQSNPQRVSALHTALAPRPA